MKTIFLPRENNFYQVGTKVKSCFEGNVEYGTLMDCDEDKHVIALNVNGKKKWTHESHVTLDF